jgi:hypothetical protein
VLAILCSQVGKELRALNFLRFLIDFGEFNSVFFFKYCNKFLEAKAAVWNSQTDLRNITPQLVRDIYRIVKQLVLWISAKQIVA